ncbi:MAG: gamma-glutamylcyclotransferase (GGCT)/AIG2-like uncharacterized protein YtfP [Halobacteriales archaeon]|jgi:gamma-glutamylcyclotransferase (GGCT)/AIG2-like uncharacterized protein YtfP
MDVFVYGTLTDPDRAFTVVPEARYLGPAKIVGLHVVEDRYPTLAPGGTATGRILRTDDVAALDEYEGVETGLNVRISVPGADGSPVETYVGKPARLGAADEVTWPGDGHFCERVRRYIDCETAVVRPTDGQ